MKSAMAEAIGVFLREGGKVTRCPEGNGLVVSAAPKVLRLIGKARSDRDMVERRAAAIGKYLDRRPSREFSLAELRDSFDLGKGSLEAALMVLAQQGRASSRRGPRRILFYRSTRGVAE